MSFLLKSKWCEKPTEYDLQLWCALHVSSGDFGTKQLQSAILAAWLVMEALPACKCGLRRCRFVRKRKHYKSKPICFAAAKLCLGMMLPCIWSLFAAFGALESLCCGNADFRASALLLQMFLWKMDSKAPRPAFEDSKAQPKSNEGQREEMTKTPTSQRVTSVTLGIQSEAMLTLGGSWILSTLVLASFVLM